jgi:glycosyltransferase involved in cell wall biosynthesis
MRIGVLTTSFPRYVDDIAGNFVLGFARALAGAGHDLDVLAPEPAYGVSPPSWNNISVQWIPYMRPRSLSRTFYGAGVLDNLKLDPAAWFGLAPFTFAMIQAVRNNLYRWDALLSHWALPCALVAGGLRKTLPHVAVFHSADLHLLRRLPAKRAIAFYIAANAQSLLFVSSALRDDFLSWLPADRRFEASQKCRVFPMGIDPVTESGNDRESLRRQFGFDRFTVLSISRLIPVKGLDDAIRALANRDDITMAIVGEGPERALLESVAAQYKAPVRFLGKVVGSRKRELLRSADAFISASRILASGRTEGMPTVILEAMAHGIPTIATSVGGVASVISHMHSGLLVPPSDQQALQSAVDRLVKDHSLRITLGARGQEVARKYTWPNMANHLASLFESA